tara:strand:+ start:170 stop:769 length:600 start_codon:yes stop_codon:yes gene_type:complete
MFTNTKFVLASKSQSRKNILNKIKLNFNQVTPKCNEEAIKKKLLLQRKTPRKISQELALNKTKSVGRLVKNKIIVGCDTVIDFEGAFINKAKNKNEAYKKIKKLSGKEHVIFSSATAFYNNKLVWKHTQKTKVKIRKLNNKEIREYLKKTNKNILGSVGCYQIENDGPKIIEKIDGDFFNVMGFPLFPFLFFLKKFKTN